LFFSKVSNEPWKLKAGVSRKPLRRPSSAKKMPLLSEDVIIQAAKVASLKMVCSSYRVCKRIVRSFSFIDMVISFTLKL
jgi:hypothetical protein